MAVLRLSELSWPEVPPGSLLVVPVGSCEQHGPHLPLDVDTRLAGFLADALAAAVGAVVAPPVTVGASGEHAGFPGTLSVGNDVMAAVVVELVRSALPVPGAAEPFTGVVLVNGHGGNVAALGRAAELLAAEGRAVLVWHPQVPGGDSHAGRTETSLLLHLDPGCVRMDRAEPGATARWRELAPEVVAGGLRAVAPNGVLGDPTTATAEEGAQVFAGLVAALMGEVAAWRATLTA
ncbi:MAG: mycofactocin biosynthesis peptidyl-dipeptidase MftE [Actinomycetes bacterium]